MTTTAPVSLADTIVPKSDQLNADDLIAGPRVVRILAVSRTSAPDQPIAVEVADARTGEK